MTTDEMQTSLSDMIELSPDFDIHLLACDMSMRALGIQRDELIDHPKLAMCGAAPFIERASARKLTLFV